jgi:hypothetical protein
MTTNQLVGAAFLVVGLVDAALALLLPRRIPDESRRRTLGLVLAAGSALMIMMGIAFLVARPR